MTQNDNFAVQVSEELKHRLEESGWPGIRLDPEGRWFLGDQPITHPRILNLLEKSIRPTTDGGWALRIGREVFPVDVADVAYFVRQMEISGESVRIRLSDDTWEPLDPTTVEYRPVGRFYCKVKGGKAKARFARNVTQHLQEHLSEREGTVWLDLPPKPVALGNLEELEAGSDQGESEP